MAARERQEAPGLRLRKALEERGMSQRAFARMIDVEEAQVSRWISGTRPIKPYRWAVNKALGEEIWSV